MMPGVSGAIHGSSNSCCRLVTAGVVCDPDRRCL